MLDECDECDKENADLNCCVDTMTAVTKHRDPATIAFDELKTKNEQLVLENLNYRCNAPRLHAAIVRFSCSWKDMRGGLERDLRLFTRVLHQGTQKLVLACDQHQAKARDELSFATERCSALEEALGERVEEVQKLEIELGEEKEKAKRKSEMYKDMKDAFEEERARAEKCKNEADRCSHDIAELRGKIETMEFTHEEIAAKLTIEEERGRQLEAESIGVRECADEEKAVVQRELAEAKLKIEELTKSVEEGKERERRLEEQNAAVREEKQLFSDDIAAFRSRLETMEANIKQAELEKASLRSDLAAALRETETVRKSLQGKLASAAAEKEALQKKTEEDSRTIESLQQKAAKVASLEDDVALLTKAAGKAKELEARLRESKGGASELAAEHKQEVERLTRRWKEHKGKLEKEIELLKSQAEQEATHARGMNKIRIFQLEKQHSQTLIKEKEKLETKLWLEAEKNWQARAEQRVKEVQDKAAAEMQAMGRRHQAAMAHVQAQTEKLAEEICELKQGRAGEEGKLRGKVEGLERDVGKLAEKLMAAEEERTRLEGRLGEVERGREERGRAEAAMVERMEQSVLSLSAKLRERETALNERDGEVQRLKRTVEKECQERLDLLLELSQLQMAASEPREVALALAQNQSPQQAQIHEQSQRAQSQQAHHQPSQRHEQAQDTARAPSCPPTLTKACAEPETRRKGQGWGLPCIQHRGPSPAQLMDARITKEKIQRTRRSRT